MVEVRIFPEPIPAFFPCDAILFVVKSFMACNSQVSWFIEYSVPVEQFLVDESFLTNDKDAFVEMFGGLIFFKKMPQRQR